jgi:hypothetical protein
MADPLMSSIADIFNRHLSRLLHAAVGQNKSRSGGGFRSIGENR